MNVVPTRREQAAKIDLERLESIGRLFGHAMIEHRRPIRIGRARSGDAPPFGGLNPQVAPFFYQLAFRSTLVPSSIGIHRWISGQPASGVL